MFCHVWVLTKLILRFLRLCVECYFIAVVARTAEGPAVLTDELSPLQLLVGDTFWVEVLQLSKWKKNEYESYAKFFVKKSECKISKF